MRHMHGSITTHRRLRLFKWLMILIPPVTLTAVHALPEHAVGRRTETLFVGSVVLVLSYLYAETMSKILRGLQAQASAREQEVLTMNAVMQERERLSRELHDGAAQLVAHLLLRLDTIKELVAADRRPEAAAELERLHGVADELYEDIGESITGIRTDVTKRGLIRPLRDYADQFDERHQIPVRLRADDAADQLSPLAAYQIFRFIQEALTNVRKHAGAREATVTLTADGPHQLRVVVADDGQGFIPGSQGDGTARSLGLTSMRERVETLGGAFHVDSRPGSGTRVIATVPLHQTSKENGHAARAHPPG